MSSDPIVMTRRARRPANAALALVTSLLTLAVSAGICAAAVLAPAPAAVVPLVVVACIGCPVLAAWDLRGALAGLRAARADRAGAKALAKLRRSLAQLPETRHPLDR